MRVVYFAWVRERVGRAEEDVAPPQNVETVSDLMHWLASRDEGSAYAFERASTIRAAIDRVHVKSNAPIAGAREIAFFPPMTGG